MREEKFYFTGSINADTLGPKHIPGDISLYTAYAKCRAIAEEGDNYGK